MPFSTPYSKNINNKLTHIYKTHIDNENMINDNEGHAKHEIVGELEHITTTKKTITWWES